jgi:hypothetical protein
LAGEVDAPIKAMARGSNNDVKNEREFITAPFCYNHPENQEPLSTFFAACADSTGSGGAPWHICSETSIPDARDLSLRLLVSNGLSRRITTGIADIIFQPWGDA